MTFILEVVVVVVVVVGTNKDWGPENKLSEPILEFAWCSLGASMEFSTVLKNNFGIPVGISSKECDNPGCRKKRFFCKNRWFVHVANPDSPFFAGASLASIL